MAVRLLDAASSTGVSTAWYLSSGANEHTVQCMATGSPTSVVVELEGSLDNGTWYQLAEHLWSNSELSNQAAMFHVSSKLVGYVRINLTTMSGGSSPTMTVLYTGAGFHVS